MSCLRCIHSVPVNWPENDAKYHLYGEGFTDQDRQKATFQCTLNPVWIEVKGMHFCSHDTSGMTVAEHNAWVLRVRHEWKETEAQRTRAIEAEKKLKALRKKIREGK